MPERTLPRYPIYIPSKGRSGDGALTAKALARDDVPFFLVVETEEAHLYAEQFGDHRILVLPFSNQGSVIPARNWIKTHARDELGADRHWQFDDNIRGFRRWYKGKRIPCDASIAIRVVEDLVDRYTNIAIGGFNYQMFVVKQNLPLTFNCHVYSATLIDNRIDGLEWRGRYNEDTDICLQALSRGYCTVLVHAFMVDKMWTMQMKGGNTDELYGGDGRLKMARNLERVWPKVVTTDRRFGRPQHKVAFEWKRFDQKPIRRDDIDWDELENTPVDEYGMELKTQDREKAKGMAHVVRDHRKLVRKLSR